MTGKPVEIKVYNKTTGKQLGNIITDGKKIKDSDGVSGQLSSFVHQYQTTHNREKYKPFTEALYDAALKSNPVYGNLFIKTTFVD